MQHSKGSGLACVPSMRVCSLTVFHRFLCHVWHSAKRSHTHSPCKAFDPVAREFFMKVLRKCVVFKKTGVVAMVYHQERLLHQDRSVPQFCSTILIHDYDGKEEPH